MKYVIALCVALAALTLPSPRAAACVPLTAVDYDGTLNAWLDIDGRIVAVAVEEDTLDWCAP